MTRAEALKLGVDAIRDWASDPCKRCGKHPLSYYNTSGLCRDCSRHHVKPNRRSRARFEAVSVLPRDAAGRFANRDVVRDVRSSSLPTETT